MGIIPLRVWASSLVYPCPVSRLSWLSLGGPRGSGSWGVFMDWVYTSRGHLFWFRFYYILLLLLLLYTLLGGVWNG